MEPTQHRQVQRLRLSDLQPDPHNARTHNERNLRAIMDSLKAHGQVEPLLAQAGTMVLVAGNGRAEAMKALGWEYADVIVLDIDDRQRAELSVRLNRTAELGGWDTTMLLQAAAFDETLLTGLFDDAELARMVATLGEPVEVTAPALDYVQDRNKAEADARGVSGYAIERPLEKFLESNIKKFEVMVQAADYEKVMGWLASIKAAQHCETNTDAVLYALRVAATSQRRGVLR